MIPVREDSNEILKIGWGEQGGQPRWNKVPAGLDENFSLEVRWRLSPKLSDGTDVADEKRRSALDGLKRLEKVYRSKGLGFYGRHFRGTARPQQSSWFMKYRKLEKANIHNPGLHFLRKALFLLIVACFLGSQHLKKPSRTLKWLIDVKITEWR